jgi:penicillin-binding protein 1C
LAPYGRNLCGAEGRRSLLVRKKRPRDLSLAEAALLAGLTQGPARLRPDRYPERALQRRSQVLDAMLRDGVIDVQQHARATAEPLVLAGGVVGRREAANESALGGPLAGHVSAWTLGRRGTGGTTTLVPEFQREVERVVAEHRPLLARDTDVAVAIVDVASASLVALVGSADPLDPVDGQVNGATARRSPGSALKPFVYAAAFDSGQFTPSSHLDDPARRPGRLAPRELRRRPQRKGRGG